MANSSDGGKKHAHELIDLLPPRQIFAVIGLLESMVDPVSSAIANAPIDDEPESPAERQAVADSQAWFRGSHNRGIHDGEVLAEFGIKPEDFNKSK